MDGNFWVELVGYATLISISAFFAGAETALTAASRARMHTLESEGSKRAALVTRLRENKEKLIGGLLLGNTLSHVAASSLAASVMIAIFGPTGVVYATFITSCMLLVFGEVVPKTYAMIHADKSALAVAPVIGWFLRVCAPILYSVEKSVHATFRAFGWERRVDAADEHEEELRGAIQLFKETLDVGENQEKGAMLRSIMDLAEVKVSEIMVHRKNVRMINADLPIARLIDEVLHSAFTRLPVWKDTPDNIIGVIHTKLLLSEITACNGDMSKVNLANAMMEPWFIPESTTLFDQLQAFRKRREHFSIMVDEYGALMGVIALEDILEEIVGEISDEHDVAVSGVRPQPDGSYIIDGKVTIRDLNREFDWGLPDEEYSTVAGLILFESQRVPNVGQVFTFFDFRFEILKKQKNQISLVHVTPMTAQMVAAAKDESKAEAGT